MTRTCSIPGCESRPDGRGWCNKHYLRWWYHGDPMYTRPRPRVLAWVQDLVDSPLSGDCIEWPFARTDAGWAVMTYRRRTQSAGRVAWQLLHDMPWPEGLEARHMCGNGHLACVNPLHIRPGTPRQNAHDRFIHAPRGKKLTTEEVETIRSAWAAGGITQGELGHRYGVHPATISRIVRGHLWTPEEAWR